MSVKPRNFIIQAVKPALDIKAARNLVRNIAHYEKLIDPDWIDDYELLGDLDSKGNLEETGGVWDFLNNIERLYSANPTTVDSDDEGAEEDISQYVSSNPHGLPVWEIVYAKYDSYTCMWIANCEYYNDNLPGLLSTIGITVWAGKHYGEPSILMK